MCHGQLRPGTREFRVERRDLVQFRDGARQVITHPGVDQSPRFDKKRIGLGVIGCLIDQSLLTILTQNDV